VTRIARADLRVRLNELIAAIDRRVRNPAGTGEKNIAADAASLREQAERRIADLDTRPHGR
jgi:hypothetical protein